ncbi:hypothetical protein HCB17_02850 [Salinispora arenicola]|uniref:DUF6197 family protein n=1 Tax=Salinispora arenicola TaxID=168697 RepID=UPI00040C7028|nr:hypothetical protein [Salinispora arenicola]NIL40224.1 hypothetical protein [Salinispora arenicola]
MNPTQKPTATPGALADLTPAVILRCAARYLELRGWTQGAYHAPDGGAFPAVCALGAIGMAAHGRYTDVPTDEDLDTTRDCRRAAEHLNNHLNDIGIGLYTGYDPESDTAPIDVIGWNDRNGQTADHVIATLNDAADEWDWDHATEEQLETYADACVWAEQQPTREGFLAWLGAR